MDDFPEGSLGHSVPFLVVSGLNGAEPELPIEGDLKDQGILVQSDLPRLETREATVLDELFTKVDAAGRSWQGVDREEKFRFRVKSTGRSVLLPPRKAQLPDSEKEESSSTSLPVLHSPFSPLSTCSRLYPDGLIDAQWIQKHQHLVPSIILSFYTITTDPTTTTLQDNRLKSDIAAFRSALVASGYKTKLAVVLLADDDSTPATQATGLQERLENIRRGSGLDPKSLFYIPPQGSPGELKNVMLNILSALYGPAVEYYRDLGRHARKKRSRGIAPQPTVPPTSGTSRTLELAGWNFRYDFKSAVLGEFRQEYDAAMKSYEQAYEVLLGPDVLDTIPSWSPRWNEARLLADIIAIRCLRLHFWLRQTSLAVKRWQAHRDRLADFVERRGHGTDNYGWQAWEARWALVMADLMDKVELQGLEPESGAMFLPPDKAVLGDRLQPFELLHHKGYWYRTAARALMARRRLAARIREEDRSPPDQKGKVFSYDTYLCPMPYEENPLEGQGTNHAQLIVDCLLEAKAQFEARNQLRIASELSLECAREFSRMKKWQDVLSILRPLWESRVFRSEGWHGASEDLCWLIRRAAAAERKADLVVAVDWELMSKQFAQRPQWSYDLSRSLEGIELTDKPTVSLTDDQHESFVDASFVFRNKESRAGDHCSAQLSLTSNALAGAAPLALSEIKITFDGSLKPIVLSHKAGSGSDGTFLKSATTLSEQFDENSEDGLPSLLKGDDDLTLVPGSTRVYELSIPLREAGEISAASLELTYRGEQFDMTYGMKLGRASQPRGWYRDGFKRPFHARDDAHTLQVQPRPPKLDIQVLEPRNQYYANEPIKLKVQLDNAEAEVASVKVDVHLFGQKAPIFTLSSNGEEEEQTASVAEAESKITGFSLGKLESAATSDLNLAMEPLDAPTTLDLHVRATYHLDSDPATPIMQMLPVQLAIVSPFEANYDLVPRLHHDPWPNLFDHENIVTGDEASKAATAAKGIAQAWCLICHYASFAEEDLRVLGMEMKVAPSAGHARCDVVKQHPIPADGVVMTPKTMEEARFELTAQKMSLDDRQPVSVDVSIVIQWQRQDEQDQPVNTTVMAAGQYLVLSTEPRVLASVFEMPPAAAAATAPDDSLMHLDITIENPSAHFLTFGLTMEPSDEFAFSGAKQTTVHLLPMSRRAVTYRLLPLVRGTFVRPGLVVRDKYFQKMLRVIPTEGMKIDKDGLLVWVPPGENEEEEEEP
ncbi:Gryzun, putative trafficking through golgi-domain-containing protein [Emericellopsis atlantica]|uniref:Gryzun, putative trafficking through golgi-domain-containing protein n=1 Tax=Emericellopsis atlantica TaxID=2614577 RepID=A0A9P8CLX0_9HYPO|nr:Gryzun, putative trafficking through golgi-domain-containing protein [Emericellopsis atlantica]KAG9251472.1 Gryzun, putative trafficking through golgi-domain-containing protein [Emericellopsis atlantica]